jgi:RHS repeat-associated protein
MRTGVTEQQLEVGGSTSTTTKTWTYDNLTRLTGEAVVSSISANSYTDTYSYDLVGNRLSKTDVVGSTTTVTTDSFNNDDQLTSESGTVNNVSSWSTSFQYDPNGSLYTVTRTGSAAESDTYGYDLQHRLNYANITRTEQGQSVGIVVNYYTYDDSGYRASGSVTVTVGGTPTTTITNYLIDTMNPTGYTQVLEEHINGSSAPSTSYVIGEAVIAQANSAGVVIYLLPDGLASTRLVADASGNITTRFAYDAFGLALGTSLGVLNVPVTRILFVGQQFDPVLLQYNLRARIYNPANGRFQTLDPFQGDRFYPVTLHRYIYAGANPVNHVDPSGQSWGGFFVAIGLVLLGFSLVIAGALAIYGLKRFGAWLGFQFRYEYPPEESIPGTKVLFLTDNRQHPGNPFQATPTWIPGENIFQNVTGLDDIRQILTQQINGVDRFPNHSIDVLAIAGHNSANPPGASFAHGVHSFNVDGLQAPPPPGQEALAAVISRKLTPGGHFLFLSCSLAGGQEDATRVRAVTLQGLIGAGHSVTYNELCIYEDADYRGDRGRWRTVP